MSRAGRSLVTGGAGFIGSNLVDALIARGDQVLVVDDLSTGARDNLSEAEVRGSVEVAEVDVSDSEALQSAVSAFAPERIFHLAAQVDVRKAIADPVHDAKVNVLGTINVLEAARKAGKVPVVFASTGGAIYGEGAATEEALPFVETAKLAPESVYGTSKLAAEEFLALYRRMYELPSLAMRFGNVYGPRQDPTTEAGVIAIFCGRLLAGEAPIVFGDGRQTRDYIFVGDIVSGLLAAEAALVSAPSLSGPYNLGTGIEATVFELAEALSVLAEDPKPPELQPARFGEVQRSVIDPSAAHRDLGWVAAKPLAEGLAETLEWARSRS